ncbi:hypothetical protein P9112_008958 [Eukaryota sp. TZLM1-RC]
MDTQSPPSIHTLKELETELESLRKENFDFKLRIFHLEERLAKLQGTSIQEASESVDVYIRLEETESELHSRDELLQRAREAIESLQEQLSSSQQEATHYQNQLQANIAASEELSRENTDLRSQIDHLNRKCTTLTSEVSDLKQGLAYNKDSFNETQGENTYLNREVLLLKDQITSLNETNKHTISEFKSQLTTLNDQLEAAREGKRSYKQRCTELVNELSRLKTKVETPNRELEKERKLRLKSETQLQSIKSDYDSLVVQLKRVQNSLSEALKYQKENERLREHNRLLFLENNDCNKKLDALQKHLREVKNERNGLKERLNECLSRIKSKETVKKPSIKQSRPPLTQSRPVIFDRDDPQSPLRSRTTPIRSRSLSVPRGLNMGDTFKREEVQQSNADIEWTEFERRLNSSLSLLNSTRTSASRQDFKEV